MSRLRAAVRAGAAVAGAISVGLALRGARGRGSLRGRVALVTGGARGLGLVLARHLAARGARIAICARDPDELERARRDLAARGADALAVRCDVADAEDVGRMVDEVTRRLGPVDVLVNVAGIIQVGPYESLSLDDYRAAMAVNFWGTVHAALAVLPAMRERGSGRIVNVTSIGGTVAVPHLLAYSASKFAGVGFSTGLAAEAARHGVRVTTVVPGLMRTGSFLRAQFKGDREREVSAFSAAASLPVLTVGVDRAARRIVRACERGERFTVVGAPWKLARAVGVLLPGTTGALLSAIARLLPPGPPGSAREPAEPGYLHRTGLARSPLTLLQDRAALRNNEEPPGTLH